MILVDTSIWIDHLHHPESALVALFTQVRVCTHPMIVGELALGSIRDRERVLIWMDRLPKTSIATPDDVRTLVAAQSLSGTGLSLVDAHLLAGLRLSGIDRLWTRDRRLKIASERLGIAADVAD